MTDVVEREFGTGHDEHSRVLSLPGPNSSSGIDDGKVCGTALTGGEFRVGCAHGDPSGTPRITHPGGTNLDVSDVTVSRNSKERLPPRTTSTRAPGTRSNPGNVKHIDRSIRMNSPSTQVFSPPGTNLPRKKYEVSSHVRPPPREIATSPFCIVSGSTCEQQKGLDTFLCCPVLAVLLLDMLSDPRYRDRLSGVLRRILSFPPVFRKALESTHQMTDEQKFARHQIENMVKWEYDDALGKLYSHLDRPPRNKTK